MKDYYVEGTGWFVVRTTTIRKARSEGVKEYGRGNVRCVRLATQLETNSYISQKGQSALYEGSVRHSPIPSPFVVPPFDPNYQKPEVRFFWWSWHPNYPTWSRYGSKGYVTTDEAWEQRAKPINSSLDLYHNKLVREGDGKFTVVADDPCRKLDVWRKIKAQKDAAAR